MKGKFDYMQLPNHIQFETVSQATKLLEKRRILYEVHEALEQQKEEYNRQKEGLQKQEEIIREADINIQEHLIKYGQSLIETVKKTNKTEERFKDDEQELRSLMRAIAEEEDAIRKMRKHRDRFELKVKGLGTYEQYIQRISGDRDLF